MTCYCGHDCARCFIYLGMTDRAMAFYKEQFGIDVKPERLTCCGGRSEAIFYLCRECPFRKCCRKKGIDSCEACPRPCAMWQRYKAQYVNRGGQI